MMRNQRQHIHRLFVAAYPNAETSENLARCGRALEIKGSRAISAAQVHLTLLFLGDIDRRSVDAAAESVRRSAAGLGTFVLTPDRIVTLPRGAPARTLAVLTDSHPTLAEIRRRLITRLARPSQRKETDEFVPHLTIVRYGHHSAAAEVDRPMEQGEMEIGPIEISDICLVESTLRASGAVHRTLERVALHPDSASRAGERSAQ